MIKTPIFFFLFLFIAFYGYPQSIPRSVISPAGGSDKTDKIALDWTMGEIAIETAVTSNGLFTQGFHQPLLIFPANFIKIGTTPILAGYTIKVYPNPVQAVLNIDLQSMSNTGVNIRLSDVNGRSLYNTSTFSEGSSVKINMQSFPAGIYLLYIASSTGGVIHTHKIIKSF